MTDKSPESSCSSVTPPVIEGFRVLENLGHGVTSSVWKAEQVSLNRLVVIKVLSERLTHEPEDVALFKAEARVAANCKHAGIVQVYDFGQSETSHCYYFVMEYISGYSVGDWIRRKGRISESEALVVSHSVADALKYAWDFSKIVHCDIKPDNIMVDGDGSIKVADLGLAHTVKSITSQPGAEATEVIITGTPNYMAPEQVRGSEPIDCRTDIYALGASLYHMVTGQLPFGESPPDIVLGRQLRESFAYPQQVNPDLSTGVTRLILKMTAKDPSARFQTWDEVLAEVIRLERQMRHREASATQPIGPAESSTATVSGSERPASTDVKTGGGLAGDGRACPHCGKPIQPQALYCGFCGKLLAAPTKGTGEARKQEKVSRLKLIRKTPLPSNAKPPAPPPESQPRSAPKRWIPSLGRSVRMVLSLCLLAFLGYGAYEKIVHERNIFIPMKVALVQNVLPVLEKSRETADRWFQQGSRLSYRLLWAHFENKPAPSADQQQPVFVDMAGLGKPSPPAESQVTPESSQPAEPSEPAVPSEPKPESTPGSESTASPAANETVTVVTSETQMESQPSSPSPAPAPSETSQAEPSKSETPKSEEPKIEMPKAESPAAPAKPAAEEEYERFLHTCKQQQPKVGDRITLQFKQGHQPIEGVLVQATAEGVMVKVPAGVIEYPFRLISDETRLLYFPEERARRLQRQKSP